MIVVTLHEGWQQINDQRPSLLLNNNVCHLGTDLINRSEQRIFSPKMFKVADPCYDVVLLISSVQCFLFLSILNNLSVLSSFNPSFSM